MTPRCRPGDTQACVIRAGHKPACMLALLPACLVLAGPARAEVASEFWPEIGVFVQLNDRSRACQPGLYIFKGENTLPDDMDGDPTDGVDPITYAPLTPAILGGIANFRVAYLEAGRYTAAFTCDFGVDIDPTRSEFNPLAVPSAGTPPLMRFTRRMIDISAGTQTSLTFP